MTTFVFANGATGALNAPITNVATSLVLQSGQGALFPNPGAGEKFALTLTDNATGLINEIVYCTARSGDTCTIVRAQEGTSAVSWVAGDKANNYMTAGTAAAFLQTAATGIYYGADTGAANALVVTLSGPSSQASLLNVPIYILVAHTNTAATPTLNINAYGAQNIAYKSTGGAVAVPINALAIGALIQVMWDGTRYQLLSVQPMPFINTTTDGYVYLPNGTLLQWGYATGVNNGGNITFDIPFPTHGVSVIAQIRVSTAGPAFIQSCGFVDNTKFSVNFATWVDTTTGFTTGGPYDIHWFATGY